MASIKEAAGWLADGSQKTTATVDGSGNRSGFSFGETIPLQTKKEKYDPLCNVC